MARTQPLIDADALAGLIGRDDLFVLDIRYDPDAEASFEAGHIPGAVHSNYARDGWRGVSGGVRNVAPPADELSALLGRIGVTPRHHVTIVSPAQTANHAAGATRVYWTLKLAGHEAVSILDGGMRAWTADPARPVATGPSRARPAEPYPVRLDVGLLSDLDETWRAFREGRLKALDARAASYFEGREKSGDVLRPGRIPGATQRDYAEAFDGATGRLRSIGDLERLYAETPHGPVVSYCNTGHTASLNWFVLSEVLGRGEVRLFDGSMSQWALDPERPMATGP